MRIKPTLLTLLLSLFGIVIFAQTPSQKPASTPPVALSQAPTAAADKRQDMKDLTHDIRYERREKVIRRHDMKNGNARGTVRTTRNIRKDKRDIHQDTKDLKADGVKHPVHRAVHRIRRQR